MSEPGTTPAPAEQAVASSKGDLAEDHVAPVWFVPQATQDNYSQIARDQASVRGTEPRAVMQELAQQFEQLHERQPLDGYDHLAAWAREHDPSASQGPTGLAVLQARALESARRDPYQAVIGDQALVEQAVTAQHALDEGVIGTTASASLEGTGLIPNAAGLSVPDDAGQSSDPAVAEQQQAAEQQRQQQSAPDQSGTPTPAAEPTPTPSPPTSGKGSRSGSGTSSTSSDSSS
jgi:hypothetical protein